MLCPRVLDRCHNARSQKEPSELLEKRETFKARLSKGRSEGMGPDSPIIPRGDMLEAGMGLPWSLFLPTGGI